MSNVIHGTGKPRIVSSDALKHTDTSNTFTSTTVVLTTGLTAGDFPNGYENFFITTVDENNDPVIAKMTSYAPSTKTVTIDAWIGATDPVVFDSNPVNVYVFGKVIDLPYCKNLIETFTPDTIFTKLENGNIHVNKRGWYYSALLDYEPYMKKSDVQLLETLFNADQGNFMFYPRKDNPNIFYKVNLADGYQFSIQQKPFHNNHKRVKIELMGVERLTDIDLTTEGTTAYGYGEFYGYYN